MKAGRCVNSPGRGPNRRGFEHGGDYLPAVRRAVHAVRRPGVLLSSVSRCSERRDQDVFAMPASIRGGRHHGESGEASLFECLRRPVAGISARRAPVLCVWRRLAAPVAPGECHPGVLLDGVPPVGAVIHQTISNRHLLRELRDMRSAVRLSVRQGSTVELLPRMLREGRVGQRRGRFCNRYLAGADGGAVRARTARAAVGNRSGAASAHGSHRVGRRVLAFHPGGAEAGRPQDGRAPIVGLAGRASADRGERNAEAASRQDRKGNAKGAGR